MFIALLSTAKPLQEFTLVTWMNVDQYQTAANSDTVDLTLESAGTCSPHWHQSTHVIISWMVEGSVD